VDGLLVPENSPGELAKAILFLLENPARARQMGRAGLEKLIERYSRNVWMDAIKPVFSNLTRMKA
jgi:glycosyltransferase involved in cell wall biosynthesis